MHKGDKVMSLGIVELIAGIFKPAAKLIDDLHTSDEERLKAKGDMLDVQATIMQSVFDFESKALEARANIVNSEAQSEHWLTATWRPITMLVMLGLVIGDTFGWLPNPLRDEAWLLLQLGIGGYVASRSVEKVMKIAKAPTQKLLK